VLAGHRRHHSHLRWNTSLTIGRAQTVHVVRTSGACTRTGLGARARRPGCVPR
jgi:hypothetical protein